MPYPEFEAMLELLALLFWDGRTGILMLLLTGAAVCDYRTHRIPNWLVLSGAIFGVIYNTALPPFPHSGVLFPLTGLGLGLLLFLPLYFVRAMGAGDVKLLAMVGAFLGPAETFHAALATMIAGGGLAILFVLTRGTALSMCRNLVSFCQLAFLSAVSRSTPSLRMTAGPSAGRLPYGVAIAIGTMGYLVLRQLGLL
jgi:prepilin peptidase CpaA